MSNQIREKSRAVLTLEKYLEEIGSHPILTPEEEIELAKKIRSGNNGALQQLVKSNLKFVVSIAKEYQYQGLSLLDLISEGNLGMIKAAQRFDETRGFKFISYAVWWIRQSILQALAEQVQVVRLPLNQKGVVTKALKRQSDLRQELGREPSMEVIACGTAVNEFELGELVQKSSFHLSLDSPIRPGDKETLMDTTEDESELSPDQPLLDESLQVEVEKVLSTLKPREAEVIKLYFGLAGADRPLLWKRLVSTLSSLVSELGKSKRKPLGAYATEHE